MISIGANSDEKGLVESVIGRITREFPRRKSASVQERAAQEMLAGICRSIGLETRLDPFRFNDSLYAVLAVHFGLGVLGTVIGLWSPVIALLLHLGVAVSYTLDSTRRLFLLRRLFPFRPSQNLLATQGSDGVEPRLRIVLVAHVDAAPTGLVFHPKLIKRFTVAETPPGLGWVRHSLLVATGSLVLLAATDLFWLVSGTSGWLLALQSLLTVPPLLAFLLNLDVVIRDQVVPGANDNLTGVAALLLLARRLAIGLPPDVEVVYVFSGCEEAGTGGAWALARRANSSPWRRENTVVVGLDTLAGGDLFYFQEAEIVRMPVPARLERLLVETAASDPRFHGVKRFRIPIGGTDAIPFLTAGYEAVSIGCVDPKLGAPRHYHLPTDTLANLDAGKVVVATDFAESFIRRLAAQGTER